MASRDMEADAPYDKKYFLEQSLSCEVAGELSAIFVYR